MNHSKRKSVLQERRAAEEVGGNIQPGSGAPQFYKGDVRVAGNLRLECKTTGSRSYSLKLDEILKIKGEALAGGLEGWALQVEFQGSSGGKRFAVIDWGEYQQLRSLRDAIATHKADNWGDGQVGHREDIELYKSAGIE